MECPQHAPVVHDTRGGGSLEGLPAAEINFRGGQRRFKDAGRDLERQTADSGRRRTAGPRFRSGCVNVVGDVEG
ncbi:hypothetical protein IscW_ISCW022883 [Ixodes scapularis]|uniref:Uncharacterized protein n=1 Tax=Ixodes scapularis TaxID=6945 RepID=B7QD56_IXOSC|nr:hypothetical protein IscW_ISCW022883 [Ixodes scapularis]|eukprot:XP_002413470.1 hypothetical protein IscW_ISCW022883 [Ixodes scapularis]